MNLDDLHFLLSPEGQELLRLTAETTITPQNHLQVAAGLRRRVEPVLAQAVLETVLLRQLAAVKFERSDEMFFTRPAMEQSSSEAVSRYRAERFAAAGFRRVADLACSVGGDALALAASAEVVGVDWDPLRIAMAQENVRVYGHGDRFRPMQADLIELTPFSADAFFFDPGRRDERGRRFFSVHEYQPPLSIIDRWLPLVPDGGIKISPGVDYAELPAEAEAEFISLHGEVKEAVLWYGGLHSGAERRATLLPGRHTLTTADAADADVPITDVDAYLYEPDKAVIRAHLVEALACQLGAAKIDSDIAYLTAGKAQQTPFARCFAVEAVMPFQLKRLRRYLRECGVGQVTVKKRGSPLEPETLRRQLRLSGEEHRIVFLTQVEGEATALIGQEVSPGAS